MKEIYIKRKAKHVCVVCGEKVNHSYQKADTNLTGSFVFYPFTCFLDDICNPAVVTNQ